MTDDAKAANRYVGRWLGIGYADGRTFFSVVQAATNARQHLQQLYNRLGSELGLGRGCLDFLDLVLEEVLNWRSQLPWPCTS